ncbi:MULTISPECIES: hypothetical protein [Rhodococcus]|jgi:hypothetical protein|uniref:Uncharacterized protein n=1 Tax=Rhodococcus opacus RKJ300 = JCM 13270 TaxID=1165867 RepID=I0WQS7_RHOOP|nr:MULTISPECIES: hypothetical protein [Rhodococcus]EID78743.1 hypothetical protein W59_16804 [Rhodococcus opacus RKJ300 = JCM 13270]MDI9937421.1 hypothetical protein [Rhodococcus sp. IEGM 1351]QQZ12875.1 hypothetical protein GO592_24355 [Rhodococcus sp. 21391]UOT05468.1 hypothetical protein MPY17_06890 [Rhodococcus opacus]GLK34970.1 hypothetical protein GCM10017611_18210 [Rhodococcus wratislaviensis]
MSHTKTRIAIGGGAAFVLSVVGAAGIAVASGTASPNADVSVSEQHQDEDPTSAPLPVFTPPALRTPTQEPPGSFDTASAGPFEPAPWR